MEVKLIDYTGNGTPDPARHAANVLVFTKGTRLNMHPGMFEEICTWSWDKIEQELSYMAKTIPSSWEMVHYGFLINGVSRAMTHQLVRTRTGSYAQQTLRILDVSGWDYLTGPTLLDDIDEHEGTIGESATLYHDTMAKIADAYDTLIENGIAIEDARGILPTNILTNIYADFNLRTITELVRKRSSGRTQGEYRDVLDAMKAEVIRVHPWAEMFIIRDFDRAAMELEIAIRRIASGQEAIDMIKLIDEMRKG